MLSYSISNEKRETYRQSVVQRSKKLSKANRELVQEILKLDERDFVKFLEEKVLKQKKEVYLTLEEALPVELYPVLDVLIGEELRGVFTDYCAKITRYSYTAGYYRRMIRSRNYRDYLHKMGSALSDFITIKALDLDLVQVLRKEYNNDINGRYIYINPAPYVSVEIDRENVEIIDLIKEMITGDNNTFVLSREVIQGILLSEDRELVELVGKLLLAAKLQEGLRQSICESMDEGTMENFEYLFHIVYENDLLRFSAVRRAVATWTGVGEEYSDRITKKEMTLIAKILEEPSYADELLKSKDNVEVLLALWYKGAIDVDDALEAMEEIIEKGERHTKLLVSYYLAIIQKRNHAQRISAKMISSHPDDLEILACYRVHLHPSLGRTAWYYTEEQLSYDKVKDIFSSKKEGRKFFEIFISALETLGKKDREFSPCIFPWYAVGIYRQDLASVLFSINAFLEGEMTDRVLPYLKLMDTYARGGILKMLVKKPKNQLQKDVVVDLLSDRSSASDKACEIIRENNMVGEYKEKIESLLRLKTGETRKNVIDLLYTQKDEELKRSIANLVVQKDENKRLGGLDLILRSKEEGRFSGEELQSLAQKIEKPTSSEEILIRRLLGGELLAEELEKLYNTQYRPEFELEIVEKGKKRKNTADKTLVIENSIALKDIFDKSTRDLLEIMKKLIALYQSHRNYEYKNHWGHDYLLGENFTNTVYRSYGQEKLEDYPLAEVWRTFYEEEIRDFKTLYQLHMMRSVSEELRDGNRSCDFRPVIERIISKKDLFKLSDELRRLEKEQDREVAVSFDSVGRVLSVLFYEFVDTKEGKKFIFDVSKAVFSHLFLHEKEKDLIAREKYGWEKEERYVTIFGFSEFLRNLRYKMMNSYSDEEEFKQAYALIWSLYDKLNTFCLNKYAKPLDNFGSFDQFSIAKAVATSLVEKDELYLHILDEKEATRRVRTLTSFLHPKREEEEEKDTLTLKAEELLRHEGEKIIDFILSSELDRGDTPLTYSECVHSIERVEGIDVLIKVLKALGKEKLERMDSYYSGGKSKKQTLSRILRISYPAQGETSEDFCKKMDAAKITQQRLVEVAMYSPQWISFIEAYLGWKGLSSGCYYFRAHMSDIARDEMGIIAKYTPIEKEDLELGAFDVDWFKSAYRDLGKERFDRLYESAKYISSGAKHSRARMFADATNGLLKVKETEEKIEDKRNKDLVASYALIPLGKNRTKDMVRRYKFLRNFLKESKQFGAQRRASEAKAVDIALENLSRNAGYSDVIRLTWAMESEMISEIKEYFEKKEIGEFKLYIDIDELGQSKVVCEKEGKQLKSLPAKLKKDKYVEKLKAAHKNLKEQYRRSRKMLEEAMEDATEFYGREISNLMKHPVVAPILQNLVFISGEDTGYYQEGSLVDPKGRKVSVEDEMGLRIAHCLDLYRSGMWADYQEDLFHRQVKQSFKQVFRELYIKTEDEKGSETSLRYAGHQVQPAKTVAALKTRRWVVDNEEGLQKVYYKQNIIAKIYALADWFSPADIEAPTLEWVNFYDRRTFRTIKIDEVPDLIFSEVMRDVDLAVSIAHVGGVDPEASHSTVEMRRAIAQFNLELFKLKNVSFTEKHALIEGKRASYTVHLGSGVIHQKAGAEIHVLPVHSQHRGRLFLPFVDEDPKTAEIMSKILLFAEDTKIKDPTILDQIR